MLVRGGGKVPDRELLTRTAAMLKAGAAGVVYGRNIIQHQDPVGMTRAIMAMLHDGAGVEQAERLITNS